MHTGHGIFMYVIFVLKHDSECTQKLCEQESVTVGLLLKILNLISLNVCLTCQTLGTLSWQ